MLDRKVRKKLLAEVPEIAEEVEELFRQHANSAADNDDLSAQFKSYRLLSRGVNRCRQLKGLLNAEKLKCDNERLEKIIAAFEALEKPKLDETLLFQGAGRGKPGV